MYLFTTPSLPRVSLPSRERLQQLGSSTITALIWAAAITVTAVRLTAAGWAWFRPRLARLLHALALLLDGGLAYPDQPEPDPTPEPTPDSTETRFTNPVTSGVYVLGTRAPAAKPRPARRRTAAKATAKGAA